MLSRLNSRSARAIGGTCSKRGNSAPNRVPDEQSASKGRSSDLPTFPPWVRSVLQSAVLDVTCLPGAPAPKLPSDVTRQPVSPAVPG